MTKKITFLSLLVLFSFLCWCESSNNPESACTSDWPCEQWSNIESNIESNTENYEEEKINWDIKETPEFAKEENWDTTSSFWDREDTNTESTN